MDNKRIFICLVLFFLMAHTTNADIKTIVLQNGNNEYSGCEDTHIIIIKGFSGDTADYTMWHDNFNKNEVLNIAN